MDIGALAADKALEVDDDMEMWPLCRTIHASPVGGRLGEQS